MRRAPSWLVAALLFVAVAEVGVRLAGGGSWAPFASPIADASGAWIRPDRRQGIALVPGTFTLELAQQGPRWATTHVDDGWRVVPGTGEGPPVWVVGGSFAYGFGVDDDATVAAALQRRRLDTVVRLHAVPGWGPVQALTTDLGDVPGVVVWIQGSFQDERAVLTTNWRRSLAGVARDAAWQTARWPALRGRPPEIVPSSLAYVPWPGARWSAAVAQVERVWTDRADRALDATAVSRVWTSARIAALEDAGHRVVVGVTTDDAVSRAHADAWERAGADVVVLSFDPSDPGDRVSPTDGHPSVAVLERWAETLARALL